MFGLNASAAQKGKCHARGIIGGYDAGALVTLVTAPARALVTASKPASPHRACSLLAAKSVAGTVNASDPILVACLECHSAVRKR